MRCYRTWDDVRSCHSMSVFTLLHRHPHMIMRFHIFQVFVRLRRARHLKTKRMKLDVYVHMLQKEPNQSHHVEKHDFHYALHVDMWYLMTLDDHDTCTCANMHSTALWEFQAQQQKILTKKPCRDRTLDHQSQHFTAAKKTLVDFHHMVVMWKHLVSTRCTVYPMIGYKDMIRACFVFDLVEGWKTCTVKNDTTNWKSFEWKLKSTQKSAESGCVMLRDVLCCVMMCGMLYLSWEKDQEKKEKNELRLKTNWLATKNAELNTRKQDKHETSQDATRRDATRQETATHL